ncbi:putative phage tail protein [Bacillus sp. JJ1474]|uniref:putative phage tail protein n=1 Tax=Bacillus sp. JJ1474 TaxID=3122955 RepID=UPI002FFD5CC4
MIDYLSLDMRKSNIYQEIFKADSRQIDIFNASIEDIKKQLLIDTATWGLAIYEKELKIKTDLNKPLGERRSVIKSKLRGSGKVDHILIKLVADAYSNGDVVVSFNGRIVVKFTSLYGIPPNLEDVKNALEDIKPAHLAIEYEFNYLLIKEIHNVKTLIEMDQIPLNKFAGGA